MKFDPASGSSQRVGPVQLASYRALATVVMLALITACASPPPTLPTPVATVMTRVDRIVAALQAMKFEPADEGWRLTLPAPLIFSFDSDVVATAARHSLTIVGRELNELGIDRVRVLGHTDNVGSKEYNLGLSKRRADAVAQALNEGGYPPDRTDTKGLGDSVPSADNTSAEGRAQNRRVVIIVQVK